MTGVTILFHNGDFNSPIHSKPDDLLTVAEFCRRVRQPRSRITGWVDNGQLPHTLSATGKRKLIALSAWDNFILQESNTWHGEEMAPGLGSANVAKYGTSTSPTKKAVLASAAQAQLIAMQLRSRSRGSSPSKDRSSSQVT